VHLFDWDEINFAEAAREMLITKDYFKVMIDYLPFWEKPPFFIWLQALSMHIFGVGEFAARFPNLICGIVTLLVLFNFGKKLFNADFALLWVMAFGGSFLPHLYFMSGIIDPVYNLFIFLSLYFAHQGISRKAKVTPMIFAGLFIGLAILTKGPVALLIFGLCILLFLLFSGKNGEIDLSNLAIKLLAFGMPLLVVSFFYYGVEFMRGGAWFFRNFFDYHLKLLQTGEAGHSQPFYYHFFVLLFGCLPASILMVGGLKKREADNDRQRSFKRLMLVLFIVVLVVFSIVRTKINICKKMLG